MYRAILAHHQELTKSLSTAYSDGMLTGFVWHAYRFRKLLMMGEKCPKHAVQ